MRDWIIQRRLRELTKEGKINGEHIIKLFEEYEQDLINGTPKEDSEARTLIVLANSSLISFILTKKFGLQPPAVDCEEYSVAKLGLIKAVDKFKLEQGLQFSTYAYHVIYNEILMYYRKINSVSNTFERNKMSIEECYLEDSKSEIKPQYANSLKDEYDIAEEVALKDVLEKALYQFIHLNPTEQIALIYCFGLGQNDKISHSQLSKKLGKSRSLISKCVETGIEKIQLLLQDSSTLNEDLRQKRRKILHSTYPLQDCVNEYLKEREEMREEEY